MLWISDGWKDYEVLDTSNGERLERWGKYVLVRPDPQVIWNTPHAAPEWKRYDARYVRSNTGGGRWTEHTLPERWQIRYKDYLTFNVKPMNFKHTGVFPEFCLPVSLKYCNVFKFEYHIRMLLKWLFCSFFIIF